MIEITEEIMVERQAIWAGQYMPVKASIPFAADRKTARGFEESCRALLESTVKYSVASTVA